MMQHFNDTINWAFTSKVKDIELAASDEGTGIAYLYGNGEVTLDVPLPLTDMLSFLQGMKLRYNDGCGIRDIVTFFVINFVEDMRLKCKNQDVK
jgi:hypothetical protein